MAMTTYELLRHFADSWMVIGFTSFFVAMLVFIFRKGSRTQYEHVSRIPLLDDEKV